MFTWTNQDGLTHTVTSVTPEGPTGVFDSGFLSSGQTFSYTFKEAGTYNYFCRVHNYMRGTITISGLYYGAIE